MLLCCRTLKKECPAFMLVSADRKKDRLVLKGSHLEHNHDISTRLFLSYPENRKLSANQKQEVLTLFDLDVNIEQIRHHLTRQNDKIITKKDLHNYRSSLKNGSTAEAMMMKTFEAMLDDDPQYRIQLFLHNNTISAI